MMGYAQRAREAAERLQVRRYRVRRWTELGWHPYAGTNAKEQRTARKDREDHLKRAAAIYERRLRAQAPDFEPAVQVVRVNGEPELMFEVTVLATDEDDARRRATYRFSRVMDGKIPVGLGVKELLPNRFGKTDTELTRDQPVAA